MKQNKENKNKKIEVAMDIEDVWRYSLETMLLVLNDNKEHKTNPNKKPKSIREIISESSVRPIKILFFKTKQEPDAQRGSNYMVPVDKNMDDAGNVEYPVCTHAETPRYII